MEPNTLTVWLFVATSAAVALFIFVLLIIFLFWWRRKLKNLKARPYDAPVTYHHFDDPAFSCGISNVGYDIVDSQSISLAPSDIFHVSLLGEKLVRSYQVKFLRTCNIHERWKYDIQSRFFSVEVTNSSRRWSFRVLPNNLRPRRFRKRPSSCFTRHSCKVLTSAGPSVYIA